MLSDARTNLSTTASLYRLSCSYGFPAGKLPATDSTGEMCSKEQRTRYPPPTYAHPWFPAHTTCHGSGRSRFQPATAVKVWTGQKRNTFILKGMKHAQAVRVWYLSKWRGSVIDHYFTLSSLNIRCISFLLNKLYFSFIKPGGSRSLME